MEKTKILWMSLLHLLFFCPLMNSSMQYKDVTNYELQKIGQDIENLFTPLNNIIDVLKFFGAEMDVKVNENLDMRKIVNPEKKTHYSFKPHNEAGLYYNVNYDFFHEFGVPIPYEKQNLHDITLDYNTFKRKIYERFLGKQISFMGLNKLLYNEDTFLKRLYMTRCGILKFGNEYFLIQRTNPLVPETEMVSDSAFKFVRGMFQHFTFTRINPQDVYLHIDQKKFMHIQMARHKDELHQYSNFTFGYEECQNKIAIWRGFPKVFIQNGNLIGLFKPRWKSNDTIEMKKLCYVTDIMSITVENMFLNIQHVLFGLYVPIEKQMLWYPSPPEFIFPNDPFTEEYLPFNFSTGPSIPEWNPMTSRLISEEGCHF